MNAGILSGLRRTLLTDKLAAMSVHDLLSHTYQSLSQGDYYARLANTPGNAVVLFSQPHCGACRTWQRLLPEALSGITLHFYAVDVARETGMARYFGIFHLPTIYLYRDGQFHAELQAEARVDAIQRAAHALLAAAPQEEP